MNNLIELKVPKETVSDDSYIVASIFFQNGEMVEKGDIIISLETSKATFDIESPDSGYLYYSCKIGDQIKIGSMYGVIAQDKQLALDFLANLKNSLRQKTVDSDNSNTIKIRISKPAEKLIREHNIDISKFSGKTIIEKKDVEEFLMKYDLQQKNKPELLLRYHSNNIVIIGGGNHTKVCIDIINQTKQFNLVGIIYTLYSPGDYVMNFPVLGGLERLEEVYENIAENAVIGVGGLEKPEERYDLFEKLKNIGFRLPNIIHPKSVIEPSAILGEGNQIFAGAVIGSCAKIGHNCIINSNSTVSHDCTIGNNVHITPGAILAGTVSVGNNSIIGMGVTIFYSCKIGSNVIISNGQNICTDISENVVVKF